MIKDQEFLKDIASYCIENSKKLGATDVGVKAIHSVSENVSFRNKKLDESNSCLLYTSPSPRDLSTSRMPSSA